MKKFLLFVCLVSGLQICSAQTQVILGPPPKLQFFDQSGRPLAFGCVFSYASGTTTPLATYTDFTGLTQNANPVPLNAGGFAGGGSSGIWLQAGQAYTLKVVSQGGTNCASGTTQYTVDGIGGGGSTITTVVTFSVTPTFVIQAQNQMFQMTLTGNAAANPLSAVGITPPSFVIFQLTQDATGNRTWSWPSNVIGGSAIGLGANQVTTQMFVWNGTNATAVGPANIGNGSSFSFTPGYLVAQNSISTGTTLNTLTKLTSAATAVIVSTTDTSGIQGITVGGAGVIGTALIQTGGNAPCVFDGATTAGHYVQVSTTVAGNCHDIGAAATSQSVGIVMSTNGAGGLYQIALLPLPQIAGQQSIVQNDAGTGTTLNTLTILASVGVNATAKIAPTATLSGIAGITIAGAGTTGSATVQQSGIAPCAFDGTATVQDFVISSPTVIGKCHDTGSSSLYPPSQQIVGRVYNGGSGVGTYSVSLFPGEFSKYLSVPVNVGPVVGSGAGGGSPTVSCVFNLAALCYTNGGTVDLLTATGGTTTGILFTIVLTSGSNSVLNGLSCTISPVNQPAVFSSFTVVSNDSPQFRMIVNTNGSVLAATTHYIISYTCGYF